MSFLSVFWRRESSQYHLHLFWLPIILYFILGVQYYQANMGGTGTDLPINLVGWALLSISLSIGLWRINQTQYVKSNRSLNLLTLLLVLLYVPFMFGKSDPQASTWYLFLALPLVWLFLLLSLQFKITQRSQQLLILTILIGTSAQLFIALAQMSIMEHARPSFGHFQQVNLVGSYIITGYACTFYLWISNPEYQKRWLWVTFGLNGLLTGFLTLQLHSRSTLISGVVVSLLCLVYILFKRQFRPLIFILCFAVGLGLSQTLINKANNRTLPLTNPQQVTQQVDERKIMYPQVIGMIKENFFTGVGYGNFESAYTKFSATEARQAGNPELIRHNMAHPHNEVLFWFTEGGVVAGVSTILILFILMYWLHQQPQLHKPVVWALFIPVGLHTLIEYPLQTSLPHLLILLILIRVFILSGETKRTPLPISITSSLRPLALVISMIGIAFCVTGLHTIHLVLQYELAAVKTPAPYLRIINPFVHYDRYWTNIMAHKAMAAVHTNNKQAMQEYIDWAQEAIEHHPKQVYFENIIRLKDYLGTLNKDNCEQYEFYFPEQRCSNLTNVVPKKSS